tara:strand:+ start:1290 stop:1505 length:216 start_codon:yes stop_codon:yes gene_type:complete
MKLNDEVIAHIAKLLQMALITGTDIVDNLRMIILDEKEGSLYLNEEYIANNDENIQKMIDKALSSQASGEM